MSWFSKSKRSQHRIGEQSGSQEAPAEKLTTREALAASVEELSGQEQLTEDEWDETEGEGNTAAMSGAALIPPRLRLQSRQMPAVGIDNTRHTLVRHEPAWSSRLSEAALPVAKTARRLGRSTKVHLQAVQPGQVQEPITERVSSVDAPEPGRREGGASPASDEQVLVKRLNAPVSASSSTAPSSILCGSGVIEAGQEDATIRNPRISAQSVVTVTLSGNPGPVVVHYISLQPRAGFTLHMSAPVTMTTAFNYAVWLF